MDGYIKGKFILVKGTQKKGKSIVKKYLFSDVREDIQQDYEDWIRRRFIFEANNQ